MADFVLELWDKYWPANVKGRAAVTNELAARLTEEGVTRSSVSVVRKFLPERLEVTVVNVSKTPTVDHYDMAERLGVGGAQRKG